MEHAPIQPPPASPDSLANRVRTAVFWRSGSQILAQLIAWASTFLVIRMLDPHDYGLFAMATVVLVLFSLLDGYGFATSLIQRDTVEKRDIRQVFGLVILLNAGLACVQLGIAPLAAAYFREPMIAHLLRVQALFYLAVPFIAISFALLSRDLKYKEQAIANLAASIAGAVTALTLASLGYGVWTLVYAPMVLFAVRAIGLTIAARSLVWPSFRFTGAKAMIGFGGAMTATQILWFVQSQSDVFIAGRQLDPHDLGLYTTALFLAQILVAKFVPPLNDVAFAAYSQMHKSGEPLADAFARSVRMIMLVALPFYCGLGVTAEPLVLTILGPQWAETAPLVAMLAFAMPFMTLQILFSPATNAMGKPWLATRVNMMGALIMPVAFMIGINWGIEGMASVWLFAFPLLTVITAALSMPVIGVGPGQLARAILPALTASSAMAIAVLFIDYELPAMAAPARLGILVAIGVASYGLYLLVFGREAVADLWQMVFRRRVPAEA